MYGLKQKHEPRYFHGGVETPDPIFKVSWPRLAAWFVLPVLFWDTFFYAIFSYSAHSEDVRNLHALSPSLDAQDACDGQASVKECLDEIKRIASQCVAETKVQPATAERILQCVGIALAATGANGP
jgi:hypothetical protein